MRGYANATRTRSHRYALLCSLSMKPEKLQVINILYTIEKIVNHLLESALETSAVYFTCVRLIVADNSQIDIHAVFLFMTNRS